MDGFNDGANDSIGMPLLKVRPEDFSVEEVASYEPTGKGTHLWMRVAKRGLSTRVAIGRIAKLLGVAPRSIGYAGQKDARAVTSQWVSLEHPPTETTDRLAELTGELGPDVPLVVSDLCWHRNRLGLGHLHGNRFRLRLRGLDSSWAERLAHRLDRFVECGAPNAFGPQRFGHRGDGALIGDALLRGRNDEVLDHMLGRAGELDTGRIRKARTFFDEGHLQAAEEAWPRDYRTERHLLRKLQAGLDSASALASVDHRELDFFISAFQSELFNALLDMRRRTVGGLGIIEGDLGMRLPMARKAFPVVDLELERGRAKRLEIAPSGPMFGPKMPWPKGLALEFEQELLNRRGLAPGDFETGLPGARRALLMRVSDASSDPGEDDHGHFVGLNFTLAKGCYATSLVHALTASEPEPWLGQI